MELKIGYATLETKAFKLLKELCTSGELQAIRSGKNTYYMSV